MITPLKSNFRELLFVAVLLLPGVILAENSVQSIDDFKVAAKKGDAEATAVLQAASDFMANRTITGMPREAADYDLDYATLMEHRINIRDALEGIR